MSDFPPGTRINMFWDTKAVKSEIIGQQFMLSGKSEENSEQTFQI